MTKETKDSRQETGAKSQAREWTESIIIALVLAMIIRTFVMAVFKIPTGSMRPTLLEGDRIIVSKFIYGAKIPFTDKRIPGLRGPKRGEVIVFIYPKDNKRYFIKRLIAFQGEKVKIKDGFVYVNGKVLNDPVFNRVYYYNQGEYGSEEEEITVPEDSYFVLGDNSISSQDSRYWGFVPGKNLVGEAILIFWPLNRIRIVR